MNMTHEKEEWEQWWDARVAAMEQLWGKAEDYVEHAVIPFDFGPDMGGAADLIYFKHHLPGMIVVTSELIGREDQIPNSLGNYELAVCHRTEESWGPDLIRRLANYTLEAKIEPGDTMEIAPLAPEGSTIQSLLFLDFARFTVRGRNAGVLLCMGITAEEEAVCRAGHSTQVEGALRAHGIYPFTDLYRNAVPLPKKGLFSRLH